MFLFVYHAVKFENKESVIIILIYVGTKLLRRCCGDTCCWKEKSKQEYKENMHMRFHLHGDEKKGGRCGSDDLVVGR